MGKPHLDAHIQLLQEGAKRLKDLRTHVESMWSEDKLAEVKTLMSSELTKNTIQDAANDLDASMALLDKYSTMLPPTPSLLALPPTPSGPEVITLR